MSKGCSLTGHARQQGVGAAPQVSPRLSSPMAFAMRAVPPWDTLVARSWKDV